MTMDERQKAKLRRAILRAMEGARPVRGRDEVALRTSDWHAIIEFVNAGGALDEAPAPALMSPAERVARNLAADFGLPGAKHADPAP